MRESYLKIPTLIPAIEKGVPIPAIAVKDKRNRPCKRPDTPWPAFLRSLEMWDSFVVSWPLTSTLLQWSRKLGIHVIIVQLKEKDVKGAPRARFWRVPDSYGFDQSTVDTGSVASPKGHER